MQNNEDVSKEDDPELPTEWKFVKDHPKDLIIGDTSKGIRTRNIIHQMGNIAFISFIEPKNVNEAISD